MSHRLVELERRALQLKNSGRVTEAAKLFSVIIEEQPNWEHGNCHLNLAQCYEDLGRFELAEEFYRAALDFSPANDTFLGGFAAFLYLHGKPEDAFEAHVKLLRVARCEDRDGDIESCMAALNALGKKMGWSRDMISEGIENSIA